MLTPIAGIVVVGALAAATDGQVTYTTAKDAYLDVGAKDGVTVGQELQLTRRNKPAGPCQVVEVSPATAVCRSERAAPGDKLSFAFTPPPEAAKPEPKVLPPMMSPGQQRELREQLAQLPVERVKHDVSSAGLVFGGRTTLRQELWHASTTPNGTYGRTSIDGYLDVGFSAAPQFFTRAAFRVNSDLIAPSNQRARPGELVELYVWGLSVGMRDGFVVGQLGRFYAENVPGVLLLDDSTEVGLYAGAIPDLVTIAPSLDRLAGGAYVGVNLRPMEGLSVVPRARLGVISSPDFQYVRGEAHAQTQVYWRGVGSVGGSIKTGMGGTADMLPSVDAASVDAGLDVLPELRLWTGYRYNAAPPLDLDFNGASIPRAQGGHDVSALTGYRPVPWFGFGASGSVAYDTTSDTTRAFVGPQLELPTMFGDAGGMQVGYVEEFGLTKVKDGAEVPGGWPGRNAWLSAHLRLPFLSFMTRASYYESEAPRDWYRELGMSVWADAPILPWLSVRTRLYGSQALPSFGGEVRATPTVGMADLSVTGSL